MKIYAYICFGKKKMGYIVYSENISASHICPPKRNKLFKLKKMKIEVFGKTWTLTCKLHIKVIISVKT